MPEGFRNLPPPPFWAEPCILDPELYDAVEVQPIRDFGHPSGDPSLSCVEPCEPHEAHFWSAYVHLKRGGVECIGDFPDEESATAYAVEVADRYGYNTHGLGPTPA